MRDIIVSEDQAKIYLECMERATMYYEGLIRVCYVQLGQAEDVRGNDLQNQVIHARLRADSIATEIDALKTSMRRARGKRSGKQGVQRRKADKGKEKNNAS